MRAAKPQTAKRPSTAAAPVAAATATAVVDAAVRAVGPGVPSAAPALDSARLAHLVGYAASRAALTARKSFHRHMAPLDLKVVEFSILMLVAQNPQVNQLQLGAALDVSAPHMAVMLDRMVERGWVERMRGTQDRRAQHIRLTARGVQLVQRADKIASTVEAPALAMLSAAEQALLIELLNKVAAGRGGRH